MIVCGDMIHQAGDKKAIEAYLEQAKKLDAAIKLYHVAGNHDVGAEFTAESIKLYENYFGRLYYSFEHENSLFIVLESTSLKDAGDKLAAWSIEQTEWLKRTLSDSDQKNYVHKFVFLHHPLVLNDMNEAEEYFNFPFSMRNELIELFKAHHVDIVFSGHLHQNKIVKLENIELVVTGSCGKALGDSSLGYCVVNVSGDRIQHSYHELPDQSMK